MWCIVKLPNSVILEIHLDHAKAIGQECLEKVCSNLGISNESDYFGLKHTTTKSEELWLNLRNPITHIHPLRFSLRVKFWVPPHLLLQESTRHQFYLHARLDLVEHRLHAADWNMAAKFVALIAQAENGDYDPVRPPHGVYGQYATVGANEGEKPNDFMHRVVHEHRECRQRKRLLRSQTLHLNLRNPITHIHPLRFSLRVKFWVPPHLLLQESTRHQFYLHARLDLVEHRLHAADWNMAAKFVALIAQAENGDYDPVRPPHGVYGQYATVGANEGEKPNDFMHRVVHEHRECRGMKPTSAEYWLLKHVSNLENFGEEMFPGKPPLGVGPHGICVYHNGGEKQTIPYTAIQSASSHKRVFRLEYLNQDDQPSIMEVKLDSRESASGLYRAITEKHAFYSCETVRSAVTKQFIRDLKGTIVSIFNEDSTLGKKYVFDIRRTCREVYDNARRALYQGAASEGVTDCIDVEGMQNMGGGYSSEENDSKESQKLARFYRDAMTCKICMDHTINTAFLPCAHVLACSECAARCDRCPLCRADITQAQRIFLPTEFCETIEAH